MKNVFASVLALGVLGVVAGGCKGGMPGMECKFNKGEVAANAQGEVKGFLDAAMELKKTADALEAEWNAEIKAMGGELKIESPTEELVLAKIDANIKEAKAKGQCEVTFEANMEASGSASGSAEGKAATGEGAKGAGTGNASASATVDVKFDVKCKAEASVKASLDVTTAVIKGHFPKVLGIVVSYKAILPKVKEVGGKAEGVLKAASDPMILGEVKCAAEAVTGIKAEARVDFSVKASASAKGEAKAG
jgi:hypothetical protein